MEEIRPKGYMRFHERKCCDNCKYCYTNRGRVPTQEVGIFCSKVEPNFQVMDEDVCDEHEAS